MNRCDGSSGGARVVRDALAWGMAVCAAVAYTGSGPGAWAQRPSTSGHVPELAAYLDRVEIAEPVLHGRLAVYPVLVSDDVKLRGKWLTLDVALSRGVLVVTEKGGGSVPTIVVENRSRSEHVFIMAGEILSGGKQARTVRRDVILAPGQRIELDVFCVEAHRWEGEKNFSASGALLPQSIQQELRRGADQARVWSEVARNNRGLGAENATGSLEVAIKAGPVAEKLGEVRRAIVPRIPDGTVGFLFVDRGRALGGEFFGSEEMARELLPKLIDSYAVDCMVLGRAMPDRRGPVDDKIDHNPAVEFFRRVCRSGSERTGTPGSGAGIRTRSGGLLGDGVSLGGTVVHFGVQIQDRIVPIPRPLLEPR
jgi:hypothetical protein